MRTNNKRINAVTDYLDACRRFHDAGIMINGSFVFGFDCDGPDVFDRTVEFAMESKILAATFHVLTPLPGTRTFERLAAEGRLLHQNLSYYDTDHAVFRRRRMTPEQLEEGHQRAYRDFLTYGSILRRSLGVPGSLKRIAYNVAWMKVDPLWAAIVKAGLMPFATRIFERVLRLDTVTGQPSPVAGTESKRAVLDEGVPTGGSCPDLLHACEQGTSSSTIRAAGASRNDCHILCAVRLPPAARGGGACRHYLSVITRGLRQW